MKVGQFVQDKRSPRNISYVLEGAEDGGSFVGLNIKTGHKRRLIRPERWHKQEIVFYLLQDFSTLHEEQSRSLKWLKTEATTQVQVLSINQAHLMIACPLMSEPNWFDPFWKEVRYALNSGCPVIIVWPDGEADIKFRKNYYGVNEYRIPLDKTKNM